MRKGMWSAAAFVALASGSVALLGAPGVRAADSQVAIVEGSQSDYKSWKFSPQEISVPAGTTVVWRNEGQLQHDVKAENGSFGSKLLNHGEDFRFQFTAPGEFKYFCSPHKDLGMVGVVRVTGDATGTTPSPAPTTPAPPGSATTTTTPGQTTTTTRAGSASGPSSTTTTTAGAGVTSTTQAPSVTPTSAPETGPETSATTGGGGEGGDEQAASDHGSEGGSEKKHKKSSPIGIAFASVSTLLLAGIAGKLLASKP